MNARTMGKVFEDLQSGHAMRTLKTLAATTLVSEVASYFKRNGFLVVNDGVGYKISQK